jgi:hypothetical protein
MSGSGLLPSKLTPVASPNPCCNYAMKRKIAAIFAADVVGYSWA